jgi:hypothetical protein
MISLTKYGEIGLPYTLTFVTSVKSRQHLFQMEVDAAAQRPFSLNDFLLHFSSRSSLEENDVELLSLSLHLGWLFPYYATTLKLLEDEIN